MTHVSPQLSQHSAQRSLSDVTPQVALDPAHKRLASVDIATKQQPIRWLASDEVIVRDG